MYENGIKTKYSRVYEKALRKQERSQSRLLYISTDIWHALGPRFEFDLWTLIWKFIFNLLMHAYLALLVVREIPPWQTISWL